MEILKGTDCFEIISEMWRHAFVNCFCVKIVIKISEGILVPCEANNQGEKGSQNIA